MFSFLFGFVIFVFSTCFLVFGLIQLLFKLGDEISRVIVPACSEFFSEENRHSFIFVLIGLVGYCVLFLGAAI